MSKCCKYFLGLVIIVLLILLIWVGVLFYKYFTQSVPQCNDSGVLAQFQEILNEHKDWTYYEFGVTPGVDNTTLSNWIETAPMEKQIRKRFCSATFSNGTSVTYTVQMLAGSISQYIVSVYPADTPHGPNIPQCDDPRVLGQVQVLFDSHKDWTYSNLGVVPGVDNTTLSSVTELRVDTQEPYKRYCQAKLPNGSIILFDVKPTTMDGSQFQVSAYAQ